ncbi:MAG: hypothetical protein ABWJ98_03600 [Hydrogenothermaceae bacterium]
MILNIAGDMKVWGQRRRLGIYDPLTKSVLAKVINKKDVCLLTSGNYFQDHIIGKPTDCDINRCFINRIFSMDKESREKFLKDNQ